MRTILVLIALALVACTSAPSTRSAETPATSTPPPTSESPTPTPSPTPHLPDEDTPRDVRKLPGLVHPVCDVSRVAANFGVGGTAPDRAYAFSRFVNGTCHNLRALLAVAPDGKNITAVSAHATMCHPHCRIIGLPDVSGDGRPEVAVGVSAGYVAFFSLFVVGSGPLSISLLHTPDAGATPFAVGGSEQSMWGLICAPGPLLTSWGAGETQEGGGPYDVEVSTFRMRGGVLTRVSGRHAMVPQGDPSLLPEDGGVAFGTSTGICGSPLLPPMRVGI